MHPTYAPNNNPNLDVVVDVDVDADAEPMIPTTQTTQTSLLNDELGSSNHECFDALIGDGDGREVIVDNDTIARHSIVADDHSDGDGRAPTPRNNICPQGRHRGDNEDALVGNEDNHCIRCKKAEERQRFLKTDELYKAALKGDWKTAKSIFDIDPSAVTMKIDDEDTALEIAIIAKQTAFVEKLVNLMTSSDITSSDLEFAAASGELRIAEILVEKNPQLPNICIPEDTYLIPVSLAAFFQNKDIAYFLFSKTNFEPLNTYQQSFLLVLTILNDYYDLALEILKKNPQLAKERDALHVLAKKVDVIGSSGKLSFWKRCINYGFKGLYNKDLMQTLAHQLVQNLWNVVINDFTKEEVLEFINTPSSLLDEAARVGNVEFLIILINSYPYLMSASSVIKDNYTAIFYTAIENRQESVFSLIYEIGAPRFLIEDGEKMETGWSMLALAGKLADPNHLNRTPGAALQMQRELSWFKEVEKIVHPYLREEKDSIKRDGKIEELTPRQLFTREHKQLLKNGEEWMTKTANSCMLVATLIATVVFAAAITVPGGIDNYTKTPIFWQKYSFTIFVISDAMALVSSTTSILIFLSILTSRYTEDDFLVSLPRKLLYGIVALFFSIVCMIVAFTATIFIVCDKAKPKILLPIIVGAIIPVFCFWVLHSKLVVDILRSAGWSEFSSRFRKRRLFI